MKHTKAAREGPRVELIEESIRPYGIAEKLQSLRLRKSMGLAQLAAHTGLSAAMLSKLENARLVPTVPNLVRIAIARGKRSGPEQPRASEAAQAKDLSCT